MRSTEKYRSYKGCWTRRRKDTREQQKNLKTSGENWTMNNRSFYNSRSMSKIKGLNFYRYLDTLFIQMENNCAELQIIFWFYNRSTSNQLIIYPYKSENCPPFITCSIQIFGFQLITFVVLHLSGPFISDILSDTGQSLVGMSR